MAVHITKKHNADGSITKRTTITRKTIFGNTKTESFYERIPPKKKRGLFGLFKKK